MFKIRYAQESDKTYWFTLDKHIDKSEFTLKVRDSRGYIICDDGKPVGIMRYNLFWDNTPFLTLIFFEEPYRRLGYGKQAMRHWENEMRELGHKMAMTSTQADEEAQHFYRKLGYMDSGCLILSGTPYDQPQEIFMVKNL